MKRKNADVTFDKEVHCATNAVEMNQDHAKKMNASLADTSLENITESASLDGDGNAIVIYQPDETLRLNVRLENETVWLTQSQLCELFDVVKSNVSYHLRNIYGTGELDYAATVQKIRTVQVEAGRKVFRNLEYYNLDTIISLGFRINSKRGIQFRQWATRILKEFMLRGYAFNQRLNQLEHKIDLNLARHEQEIGDLKCKVDFFVQTSMPPVQGVF